MLAQDFRVIADLLAEGITEDDVRTGIVEALERRTDGRKRFRSWTSFVGWCRTAAQNRLAAVPRAPPSNRSKPEDHPHDPRIDFGGGYTAPVSTVRSIHSKGGWLPDWGPRLGEPGCRVPEHLVDEIRAPINGAAA